jgi:hypothetical protein
MTSHDPYHLKTLSIVLCVFVFFAIIPSSGAEPFPAEETGSAGIPISGEPILTQAENPPDSSPPGIQFVKKNDKKYVETEILVKFGPEGGLSTQEKA